MATIDLVISQTIATTSGISTQVVRTHMTKMMPQVGHKLQDRAFGDVAYPIEEVVLNFDADEVTAYLQIVMLDGADIEQVREYVRDYEKHGWECIHPI
jgi:hypothetical protein